MAGIIVADAVGGVPSYTGAQLRALLSAYIAVGNPTRPLGTLSAVKGGTPSTVVTATGTTWTVLPHAGLIDAETSALASGYPYIFTANQTGAVTAANASNPRVDLISIRIDDPAQSDGSSVPAATAVYTAGTAASTPSPPATPARSLALAYINVPTSGGGSPTVSLIATSLGGGIVTVPVGGTYPATPYVGMYVDDASTGALMRWNGTVWVPFVETSYCRVSRTTGLAGVGASGSRPATWDAVDNYGADFTASTSTGPIVAAKACRVFWSASVPFPTGTGFVVVSVEVNGTPFASGRQSSALSATHIATISAGGLLSLSAGDSVQLVVTDLDATITTGTPLSFGMTRVG